MKMEQIELPPGFRFHPTDEELVTDYLLVKSTDPSFVAIAIGEADLRKLEPWEIPGISNIGEDEWYVFTLTERRYPTGQRTNRGTDCGYWKATGKDKEIYRGESLVGMRKTLVFYQGRAPKGVKSNWVMHEYRLDGISPKSDWVISRVFHKNNSGKKTQKSSLPIPNSHPTDFTSLPPLISYSGVDTKSSLPSTSAVETNSYWSNFSDHLGIPEPFFNDDSPISKFLMDDDGAGNDLLSSLKTEKWTDTASGSSCYGVGGGYFGGDENDHDHDHDRFDTNSYTNF